MFKHKLLPEKVDLFVLVSPLCYFSLLLVVSVAQYSRIYKLPLGINSKLSKDVLFSGFHHGRKQLLVIPFLCVAGEDKGPTKASPD